MKPPPITSTAGLERCFRANVGPVTAFVARRAHDPDMVADVVAATFLELVRTAHAYRPRRGSERAWLFGIARHRLADAVRANRREIPTGDVVGRDLLAEDEYERLENAIDALRIAPGLRAAIDRLPAAQRELVLLVSVDGLSPSDAAAVLGIPAVAARMRLSRARRQLASMTANDPLPTLTPQATRSVTR
jgi:RNA polymerase sigma-70 factor, ECF subfamily